MGKERKVVLIVDDEDGMREMLLWCLRASEFDVVSARDGAEAVAILESREISLVVTDVTMPKSGGFAVLEAAGGRTPRVPSIVMTGFGTVEMAVHAMRRGASDFLLKPVSLEVLVARIRETLGEAAEFSRVCPAPRAPL